MAKVDATKRHGGQPLSADRCMRWTRQLANVARDTASTESSGAVVNHDSEKRAQLWPALRMSVWSSCRREMARIGLLNMSASPLMNTSNVCNRGGIVHWYAGSSVCTSSVTLRV